MVKKLSIFILIGLLFASSILSFESMGTNQANSGLQPFVDLTNLTERTRRSFATFMTPETPGVWVTTLSGQSMKTDRRSLDWQPTGRAQ